VQKYKNHKKISEVQKWSTKLKKNIFALRTSNTMNVFVNSLSHTQMIDLLSQMLQLEENGSDAVGRKVRVCEGATEVIKKCEVMLHLRLFKILKILKSIFFSN